MNEPLYQNYCRPEQPARPFNDEDVRFLIQSLDNDIRVLEGKRDVGTDNGDEVGAIFLTGDEDFDKEDRIPLAKEMVKRFNLHTDLMAHLRSLLAYAEEAGTENDPELEEARKVIANAEKQEGVYFPS